MKNTLLYLLLFLTCNCFSQTIDKLDERNGFKDFKLGDSFDKWKTSLEYIGINPDEEKLYKYTGVCCKDVFDSQAENIELIFAKNGLIYIGII